MPSAFMVDASIVLVENAHKHMERDRGEKSHAQIILDASKEVGPALFYSLLIITVSFIPVFSLQEQSGRMFKPLAYTKTFSMAASSILSITIIPILMTFFVVEKPLTPAISKNQKRWIWAMVILAPTFLVLIAGIAGLPMPGWSLAAALALSVFAVICLIPQKIISEIRNPISRFLIRIYRPMINMVLKWRKTTVLIAVLILAATVYPARHLGSEFMPPLNEGDLLYMPTTLPHKR